MTLDEVIAALSRGCCTEARAREAGCGLCVARYDAIAQVRAWHAELEAARPLAVLVAGAQCCEGDDARWTPEARDAVGAWARRNAQPTPVDELPRHPPPTTFLALDGTETPIEEALRRAAEEPSGIAGDRCEIGNECSRLGCPECQQ